MIMKRLHQIIYLSCLVALGTISCNTSKQATSGATMEKKVMDPYAGAWDYVVSGTPDVDIKGTLLIEKDGDQYKATMNGNAGTIEVGDVQIIDNKIKGILNYQGYRVDMSGTFEASNLKGKVEVDYTTFPLTATRRNP